MWVLLRMPDEDGDPATLFLDDVELQDLLDGEGDYEVEAFHDQAWLREHRFCDEWRRGDAVLLSAKVVVAKPAVRRWELER